MTEALLMEFFLIIFLLLFEYAISQKYIGLHLVISGIVCLVVFVDFSSLMLMFSHRDAAGIYLIGLCVIAVFIALAKIVLFVKEK